MDELSWNGLVTSESRVDRAIVGALRSQDLSGFEIWRWLGEEDGTAGLLTEADLYPTLYRLEADRLLQSDWHEAERTRRRYRLTATALQRADENGWPPIAFRRAHNGPGQPDRPTRPASPDPETGSWFVSPVVDPVAARPPSQRESHASEGRPDPGREPQDAGGAAIDRYVHELDSTLDLPESERSRVRQEIADHLCDSASGIDPGGSDAPEAAAGAAIRRLGDVRHLATRIERAQQTLSRRNRGIRRAIIELVGEMVIWLALSVVVFAVAPGIADQITALSKLVGLHVVVLRSYEWTTNQVAIMVCVGAFAAGRLSMGHLARISRHRDATLRKPWALAGAASVLALALVLPGYQDVLVVATLLAAPLAFIAGTFRPKHAGESSYSLPAVGVAVVVVAAVVFLPGGRSFAFDPNGTPGAPFAQPDGQGGGTLSVNDLPDGSYDFIAESTRTGTLTIELWAATTNGPFLTVDGTASRPAAVLTGAVDLAKPPPYRAWWVAAIVTDPDGHRMTVAVMVHAGAPPIAGTALGWLLSKL